MGWYLEGRVTGVVGTIPRADGRCARAAGGTALLSDSHDRAARFGHRVQPRRPYCRASAPCRPLRRGGRSVSFNAVVITAIAAPAAPARSSRASAWSRCRPGTALIGVVGRPPRARRIWPWPSRGACRSRSWSRTRARCTADGRRHRHAGRRRAEAVPHHLIDLESIQTSHSPWPTGRAATAPHPGSPPAAACRWSWEDRAVRLRDRRRSRLRAQGRSADVRAPWTRQLDTEGLDPLAVR